MPRTNTAILREQNEKLSTENAELRAKLVDSEAHVQRLRLVIAKRYAEKPAAAQRRLSRAEFNELAYAPR